MCTLIQLTERRLFQQVSTRLGEHQVLDLAISVIRIFLQLRDSAATSRDAQRRLIDLPASAVWHVAERGVFDAELLLERGGFLYSRESCSTRTELLIRAERAT